ncbi:MAG: cryptochrome/photolyase family protein [Myxococcota bacterium]
MSDGSDRVFIVLGNQLFPRNHLEDARDATIFMAEDVGLCTYVKHHKLKITLFLAAMRAYADELREQGFEVHYERLESTGKAKAEKNGYEAQLGAFLDRHGDVSALEMWEVEDRFFEERLQRFAKKRGLSLTFRQSPMFLTSRETFANFVGDRDTVQMASFYSQQRKRLDVMMDGDKPRGGKWSFDHDNREKIPADLALVETSFASPTDHVRDVAALVDARFADHPGDIDLDAWWLPTTRRQSLWWLRSFLSDRFADFGPYEDALTVRQSEATTFLWHSALSPVMNMGLVTPEEIVSRALTAAEEHDVPINSLEGFVRQVIGWREFIRGVYQTYGPRQEEENFFDHHRQLGPCWWKGDTGIPPLDDMVARLNRFGWAHHIERLMVAGTLMTLCEIEPREAHRWFMEMFVDSSDWVMGPNVYGMALFSDGGIFASKPYLCGSNYILKMSDYKKPRKKDPPPAYLKGCYGAPQWPEVWDGLYWRFIEKHRDFFTSQPRLSRVVGNLDRMGDERRQTIFGAAEAFLDHATV